MSTSEPVARPTAPVSTDEELVAKLRGQLDAARDTLNALQQRDLRIDVTLSSDDADVWFCRVLISRTTYL